MQTSFINVALSFGIFVPIIYFSMQLIAAFFHPNYSFLQQTASELGANSFRYSAIFNGGIFILGIITLLAALGFWRALLKLGTNSFLAALVGLAIAANGIGDLWAAYFSLPDPRHAQQPPILMLMLLMPLFLTLALWRNPATSRLRGGLIACMLLIVLIIPLMSGAIPFDHGSYAGLIQRILAIAIFLPIGIGAYFLRKYLQNTSQALSQSS
jgi:hypothetical membrane protein